MKRLIFLLILCAAACCAQTPQGLSVTGSQGATANIPSSSPYTTLGSYRIEMRLRGCSSGGFIYQNNAMRITDNCSQVCLVSFTDSTAQVCASYPSGTTDAILRVQRVQGTYLTAEVWRADTGDYRQLTATATWGGSADFSGSFNQLLGAGAPITATLDFFRFFSTTVALGTIPSNSPGGDLIDWELDGTPNDSSTHHVNLSLSGGPGYTNTLTYPPIVSFTGGRTCFLSSSYPIKFCSTSNQQATLSSVAYSVNQNDTITYSWAQSAGPTTATIANGTTATATATNLSQFGEYDFALTVTDSESNQTTGTLKVGSVLVSTTNPCIISSIPSNVYGIVGPLTPWGSTCDPWPWYDVSEIGDEEQLRASYVVPTSDTVAVNPGTITVDSAGNVTGVGTHFTTDCGGNCAATNNQVVILWNAEGGTGNGRYWTSFHTVTSDTTATISAPLIPSSSGFVNVQYRWGGAHAFDDFGNWYSGTYNFNYYDQAIAIYRIYYRTGITQFLTDARTLIGLFWTYGLDHGYGTQIGHPRMYALGGIMVRALESGNTAMWPGIERLVAGGLKTTCSGCQHLEDVREDGYQTIYQAFATEFDPNVTGNPTTQATYCTTLANNINNFWMVLLNADTSGNVTDTSYWLTNQYALNPSFANSGNNVAPWQAGIAGLGFTKAYEALASSNCSNSSAATHAQNLAFSAASFVYQYGAAGTRTIPASNGGGQGRAGITYLVGAQASGLYSTGLAGGPAQQIVGMTPATGSISGTFNSPTITGVGTNFVSGGMCNSMNPYSATMAGISGIPGLTFNLPNYLGILFANQLAGQEVHRILSCDSDTQITLADNVQQTFSGRAYEITPSDSYVANCAPGRGNFCQPAVTDFTLEIGGMFGNLYHQTHRLLYRLWVEDLFGLAYGGPDGGPGTSTTATGLHANGTYASSYIDVLPTCTNSNPPCGGQGNPTYHLGKEFGQGSGITGSADNVFAFRLMIP